MIYKITNAEVLCDATIDGFGLVYLLDFIVAKAIQGKTFVEIKLKEIKSLERPVHIIYKKIKQRNPIITESISFLEKFLS